jgi:hypothetical protein
MTMKNQNGVTVVILKNSGQESGSQLSVAPGGMQIQMKELIWSSGNYEGIFTTDMQSSQRVCIIRLTETTHSAVCCARRP